MTDNDLSRKLLNKHSEQLNLKDPLYIESDNDLFKYPSSPNPSATIFLPKSKALIDMTLAIASGMVSKDGTIVLVGEKSAGIESAKKAYEKNIGPVEQKIVGYHSSLYVGRNKQLGAGKKIEDFISYSPIEYGDIKFEVANLPGVFSSGELDEGTRLLLEHIPYDKKKILDVGCGSGIIGTIYKMKNPESEVAMSDSSKLAVLASEKTLEKNNLSANVFESDVFDAVEGKFDLIITNPPFHKGVETDYSFIEKFAKGARSRLEEGGQVLVVANSFLPYKEILEKHIGKTDIITDTKKFRVYRSKTGL